MYQNLKIVIIDEDNLKKDNGLDNLFLREWKILTKKINTWNWGNLDNFDNINNIILLKSSNKKRKNELRDNGLN